MIFGILAVSHLDSYIIAAIGGFIGACVATCGTWFLDWRRHVTERKQVAAAVMAELEAVLQMVYTAHIGKLGFLPHPIPSNLALLYTFALAVKEDFRTLYEIPDTVDVQFLIQFEKNLLLLLNLTVAIGD
jgi:hypothetical protein